MADPDEGWISAEDAAKIADVSPTTIWRAADNGHIRSREEGVGKRPRRSEYLREDVERWSRERTGPQMVKRMKGLEEDLHRRIAALEADRDEHAVEIADLRARVERLERPTD